MHPACSKKLYPSRWHAERALPAVAATIRRRGGSRVPVAAHPCYAGCNGWHLTSHPSTASKARMRAAAR
jgi:hypothetical protein